MGEWRQSLRQRVRACSEELAELLGTLERRGAAALSPADALRLGALFRQASAYLAELQTDPAERHNAEALRELVVRAHGHLYRPRRVDLLTRIAAILAWEMPRLLRRTWRAHAASAAIFALGITLGFTLVADDPDRYPAIHQLAETRAPTASVEHLRQSLLSGRDADTGSLGIFASYLWVNNTRVSVLVFCLGALAGVPTVLLLLQNGLVLGAMTQTYAHAGLGVEWGAWLIGHGVSELGACVLAGGAGLELGRALLRPGDRSRLGALSSAAREMLVLLWAIVPMLVAAALLEGFFRQSEASTALRYAVGAVTGLGWLAWFGLAGRGSSEGDPSAPLTATPPGEAPGTR